MSVPFEFLAEKDSLSDHQVLCRLFDDFVWWNAEKYSCSSCFARSDMLFEFEWSDDSDVIDDEGVRDRCESTVLCRFGDCFGDCDG